MDTRLRRPPKQQRSRGRVEEILAAARKLIGEKGIDAVKMRDIAALAGGPISSVYQYFPNKSAILATLFEIWSEELDGLIVSRLSDIGSLDDLVMATSDLLDYFYSRVSEDPAVLDLLNAVQADKTLTDLDLGYTRQQAEYFCEVGERFIPEPQRDEFRRITFMMFHLSFAAVRLAIWKKQEGVCVLGDFKRIIQGQIKLLTIAH